MTYSIDFIKYFSDEEKEKVRDYIESKLCDLELHHGYNYSIDVSIAVGRTANVDIEVKND